MTTYYKLLTLILLTTIWGCNNQAEKNKSVTVKNNTNCKPYFIYEKVEHYYYNISEDEISKIKERKKKSNEEIKKIELLIQYTPDKLSDTVVLQNIDKIGFVKKDLVMNKFEQLDLIFCEKKHKETTKMACTAIYRDILVFKQSNKIVGIAKICFQCRDNVITGTHRNTIEFGQSGDYEKLFKLLH